MSESEDRIAEIATLEKLGPEVESLFASGREPEPLMRHGEVDPIVRLLKSGANVALVGPSGIGKRSLALSLRRSREWETMGQSTLGFGQPVVHPASWPVYCTSTMNWVSGSFYVGNLENRIFLLLRSIGKSSRRAIVLFDAIHTAVGAWQAREEQLDLVDLLLPVVNHAKVSMIATATPQGWARLAERHAEFAESFVVLQPPAPTTAECRTITERELTRLGIDPGRSSAAVDELFVLAARHFAHEPELVPVLRILGSLKNVRAVCKVQHVRAACASLLRVKRCWVGADRTPPRFAIVNELEQAVFGQDEACEALADDLLVWAQGLANPERPRSYLFAGPPGIGKTSLAFAAQSVIGGSDVPPLRFDSTEYSSPGDVARLLGSNPGSLTVGLLEAPGRVVVFDEFDKAHPYVRDVLYQLLEGRVTSLEGTMISTTSATVILTTNAGSEAWTKYRSNGERSADARQAAMGACLRLLGPAIASRVDRILVFPPLAETTGVAIARAEVERFAASPALRARAVRVAATPELVDGIARAGLTRTNGARGIKKVVHSAVAAPVAQFLSERRPHHCRLLLDAVFEGEELAGVNIEMEVVL